jgi:hypothetical protein
VAPGAPKLDESGAVVSAWVTVEVLLVLVAILGAGAVGHKMGYDQGKKDAEQAAAEEGGSEDDGGGDTADTADTGDSEE